jgi:hypothetical protein
MAADRIVPLRDWVEPAHPTLVQLFDDLVALYTHIKDKYQAEVDRAFDNVSRQIGYVVTTSIPVVLHVQERDKPFKLEMGSEALKGTLFEKALNKALNPQPLPPVAEKVRLSAGTYKIYLFWYSALKLRLRTDWMEPAHVSVAAAQAQSRPPMPYPQEPAHWFDAGSFLPQEELVLINAIDNVYPELKLADRITATREVSRLLRPGVREPAHFRPEIREPAHSPTSEMALTAERAVEVLSQIAAVLRRAGL